MRRQLVSHSQFEMALAHDGLVFYACVIFCIYQQGLSFFVIHHGHPTGFNYTSVLAFHNQDRAQTHSHIHIYSEEAEEEVEEDAEEEDDDASSSA